MEQPDQQGSPYSSEKAVIGDAPQMSELATLGNIFFEPGRTFQDLRRKPRWIMATVIMALLVAGYTFGLLYKVGDEGVRRAITEQIDRSPRAESLTTEQKTAAVDMQMKINSVTRYVVPVFVVIAMLIGGLLYWLGSKAFGGDGGFLHNLSVWVYASLPPTVIGMLASFIVMIFKSADEIDLTASQRGLVHANPAFFMDGKSMPVLTTLVSAIDLFAIWGWILAAIGLRYVDRLSSGSAWAVVIIFAVVGVILRLVGAFFSGSPS